MSRSIARQLPAEVARLIRLATITLALGSMAGPARAEKTDVIVLDNGDHITGEVMKLNSGQLQVKTDHIGTIYLDWTHIVSLITTQQLQIELADGKHLVGPAPEPASNLGWIRLLSSQSGQTPVPVEVPISDVVQLKRLNAGEIWLDRLEGNVSLGYSYTSANGVQTADFSGLVGTRNSQREWKLSLDSETTHQQSGTSTQRDSLALAFSAFLPDHYYRESSLQFARNVELGLDLRSQIGQTVGRYFVQRQGTEWRAGVGLAASDEIGSDGLHRRSIWAELATDLFIFRWDRPKTNISASLQILPSLNEGGRVRSEASLNMKHELLHDFFVQITFNDSFDNRPAESARSNDWNVVTSLGYSF